MNEPVVVISGASTGIGRATALLLDEQGFRVVAGVRRQEDGEALRILGERIDPVTLDVTDQASIDAAATRVAEMVHDSRLAAVVNNAGIGLGGPVEFTSIDDWRRQFEVNLFGHVAVIRSFIPLLRENRGRIVNISSLGGKLAQPFAAPYTASKHALEALSDALRLELKPWGIDVAIIEPGAVATPLWEKSARVAAAMTADAPAEMRRLYGAALAVAAKVIERENERGVPPDRVARAVLHAITASRPKTRYPVGPEARVLLPLRRFLPDRVMDRFLLKAVGLPTRADQVESAVTPAPETAGVS